MPSEEKHPMELKELRKMADLTQFQLAQRCGVSRMRLSLAECGQLDLDPREDAAVRKVLREAIEHRAAQIRCALASTNKRELASASA
jgi:transcriptional regulator with XRE-family HTH domain